MHCGFLGDDKQTALNKQVAGFLLSVQSFPKHVSKCVHSPLSLYCIQDPKWLVLTTLRDLWSIVKSKEILMNNLHS